MSKTVDILLVERYLVLSGDGKYSIIFVFNPIALRMAKTLWSFGHSECSRVNGHVGLLHD